MKLNMILIVMNTYIRMLAIQKKTIYSVENREDMNVRVHIDI